VSATVSRSNQATTQQQHTNDNDKLNTPESRNIIQQHVRTWSVTALLLLYVVVPGIPLVVCKMSCMSDDDTQFRPLRDQDPSKFSTAEEKQHRIRSGLFIIS